MARAVGIDLGTTNSVVAVLSGGEPEVIANAEGSRTTPSVVAFAKNGEVLVGEVAKRQAVTNVDRTIRSVKRHMGDASWKVDIDGKAYNAQEISARVLQKLKRDAESYLGETVTDAVITVPAYFNDAQRQATKEAGTIAGLNVLRIVNEPTAAALAYGLDKGEKEQTILVFDLGGGTFDVSLLEIGDGVIEVKATSGDNHLGGDDWDQRIIDWLVDKFKAGHGIDLTKDKMAMQRLREAAEKAKIELSCTQPTGINLPYITQDAEKNPLFLDESLPRRVPEDHPRSARAHQGAVPERDRGRRHQPSAPIDHVVLVGGSTRMPAVTELVKDSHRRQGAEQGRQPGCRTLPVEWVTPKFQKIVNARIPRTTHEASTRRWRTAVARPSAQEPHERVDDPGAEERERGDVGGRVVRDGQRAAGEQHHAPAVRHREVVVEGDRDEDTEEEERHLLAGDRGHLLGERELHDDERRGGERRRPRDPAHGDGIDHDGKNANRSGSTARRIGDAGDSR